MKANVLLKTILFCLILSSIFGSKSVYSQDIDNEKVDEEKIVYWFYINLKVVEDKKYGLKSFQIRTLGNVISHGTLKKYDLDLWRNLGGGTKMAIGPFFDYDEAAQALLFYDVKETATVLPEGSDLNREVFWFIVKIKKRERSGSFELKKVPAAVGNGSYESFEEFLKTALMQQQLAIGPFWNAPEAEESKRMYRLTGD